MLAIDWATTFKRFRPGRIPVVGSVGVQVSDWARPQPGQAPMFDQRLLERLSFTHPAPIAAIYGPSGAWFLWQGARAGIGIISLAGAYLLGLGIWSLVEYIVHRVPFHHVPTTRLQVAYAYLVHGVHHAYPDDSRRWMLPLVVTVPLAAVFWMLFVLMFDRHGAPLFAGFIHGYLTYDLLHYFIHRGRLPTRLGRFLRQHHLTHHYALPDRHFGVSSPLWDFVFRTR